MSGCPLGKKEESPNYAECENETATQRRPALSTAHGSTSEWGGGVCLQRHWGGSKGAKEVMLRLNFLRDTPKCTSGTRTEERSSEWEAAVQSWEI